MSRESGRVLVLAIAVAALVLMAPGQAEGQGAPGQGGQGGSGGTVPSPSPSPGPDPGVGTRPGPTPTPTPTPERRSPFPGPEEQQRQQMPEFERPIFLSGKVMMEDGTPPPDSVVIERVCNGIPRPEAYTDSKGRFSFQLGENRGMLADASVGPSADDPFSRGGAMGAGSRSSGPLGQSRRITERDLMGCELRAVLPGFRSEPVNLAGRRMFDNPDVGTIVLRRLGNVEGTTISFTSLQAPKDAKKAFEKGREALRKKKFEDARKQLEKAVAVYPKYASAWYELGFLKQQQKDVEGARQAYAQALAADPKFVSPYLQMAVLAAGESKWQEVADISDRVVRLNPIEFPQAYFFNSVANYNLGKLDTAEKSAREALKLDSQHRFPRIPHLLGMILAQRQDYGGAAEQMRSYLKFAPNAQDAEQVKKQLAEMERLSGSAAAVAPQQP